MLSASRKAWCAGCFALQGVGFGLGVLAIPFPVLVLYTAAALIGLGWMGALHWLLRPSDLADPKATGAASGLALLGVLFGFSAGLLVASEGRLDVMLLAFAAGTSAAAALIKPVRNSDDAGARAREASVALQVVRSAR